MTICYSFHGGTWAVLKWWSFWISNDVCPAVSIYWRWKLKVSLFTVNVVRGNIIQCHRMLIYVNLCRVWAGCSVDQLASSTWNIFRFTDFKIKKNVPHHSDQIFVIFYFFKKINPTSCRFLFSSQCIVTLILNKENVQLRVSGIWSARKLMCYYFFVEYEEGI